ncbi:MAG: hypothetical protein EBR82_51110 [Caulobacteraceae bacterium]|jgi:hypothetical protein|nr:hypothetical protein [Caulobacteraceae bacterium]
MDLRAANLNKWTKEECRRKYIEDFAISLKAISILSGVSKTTLSKWCKEGNWVEDKKEYHKNKESNNSTKELSDIASHIYQLHYQMLVYASKVVKHKISDISQVDSIPVEQRLEYLKSEHNSHDMDAWSRIISRSTDALAKVTGLHYYTDINAAIKRLEKEGLGVIDISMIQDDDLDS